MFKYAAIGLLVALVSAWDETVLMQVSRKSGWFHDMTSKSAEVVDLASQVPIKRSTAAYAQLALYKEKPKTPAKVATPEIDTGPAKKQQQVVKPKVALLQDRPARTTATKPVESAPTKMQRTPQKRSKDALLIKPTEAHGAKPTVALLQERPGIKQDDAGLMKPIEAKKSIGSVPSTMQAKPQKAKDNVLLIKPTEAAKSVVSTDMKLLRTPQQDADGTFVVEHTEAAKSVVSADMKLLRTRQQDADGTFVVEHTEASKQPEHATLALFQRRADTDEELRIQPTQAAQHVAPGKIALLQHGEQARKSGWFRDLTSGPEAIDMIDAIKVKAEAQPVKQKVSLLQDTSGVRNKDKKFVISAQAAKSIVPTETKLLRREQQDDDILVVTEAKKSIESAAPSKMQVKPQKAKDSVLLIKPTEAAKSVAPEEVKLLRTKQQLSALVVSEAQAPKPKVSLLQERSGAKKLEKANVKKKDQSLFISAQAAKSVAATETKLLRTQQQDEDDFLVVAEAKKSIESAPSKMQVKPQKGKDDMLLVKPTEASKQPEHQTLAMFQKKANVDEELRIEPIQASKQPEHQTLAMFQKKANADEVLRIEPIQAHAQLVKQKVSLLQDMSGLKKEKAVISAKASKQPEHPTLAIHQKKADAGEVLRIQPTQVHPKSKESQPSKQPEHPTLALYQKKADEDEVLRIQPTQASRQPEHQTLATIEKKADAYEEMRIQPTRASKQPEHPTVALLQKPADAKEVLYVKPTLLQKPADAKEVLYVKPTKAAPRKDASVKMGVLRMIQKELHQKEDRHMDDQPSEVANVESSSKPRLQSVHKASQRMLVEMEERNVQKDSAKEALDSRLAAWRAKHPEVKTTKKSVESSPTETQAKPTEGQDDVPLIKPTKAEAHTVKHTASLLQDEAGATKDHVSLAIPAKAAKPLTSTKTMRPNMQEQEKALEESLSQVEAKEGAVSKLLERSQVMKLVEKRGVKADEKEQMRQRRLMKQKISSTEDAITINEDDLHLTFKARSKAKVVPTPVPEAEVTSKTADPLDDIVLNLVTKAPKPVAPGKMKRVEKRTDDLDFFEAQAPKPKVSMLQETSGAKKLEKANVKQDQSLLISAQAGPANLESSAILKVPAKKDDAPVLDMHSKASPRMLVEMEERNVRSQETKESMDALLESWRVKHPEVKKPTRARALMQAMPNRPRREEAAPVMSAEEVEAVLAQEDAEAQQKRAALLQEENQQQERVQQEHVQPHPEQNQLPEFHPMPQNVKKFQRRRDSSKPASKIDAMLAKRGLR